DSPNCCNCFLPRRISSASRIILSIRFAGSGLSVCACVCPRKPERTGMYLSPTLQPHRHNEVIDKLTLKGLGAKCKWPQTIFRNKDLHLSREFLEKITEQRVSNARAHQLR